MKPKAGYADVDITPRKLGDLNGFGGRVQPATSFGSPIMSRVFAISSGRSKLLFISCDLLGFRIEDSIRIEQAISNRVGIAVSRIFLTCTHTHSGPMSMPLGLTGRFDVQYENWLLPRLVECAAGAFADLQDVSRVSMTDADISEHGKYRCVTEVQDRHHWPGRATAIHFDREAATSIHVVHMGVHPYVLGWKSRVMDPDFPGAVCESISKQQGGNTIYLAGAGADVSCVPEFTTSMAKAKTYGKTIANLITRTKQSDIDVQRISNVQRMVRTEFGFDLPSEDHDEAAISRNASAPDMLIRNYRVWRKDVETGKLPRYLSWPMRITRLGNLLIVGLPCEVFCQTQLDLQKQFPEYKLLIISHCGGNFGYLPRDFAYAHRTYETTSAHRWYGTRGALLPEVEPAVRERIVEVVREHVL